MQASGNAMQCGPAGVCQGATKLKKVGCQWKVVCTEGSDCQTCHIGYSDLRAPSKVFLWTLAMEKRHHKTSLNPKP